MIAARSLLPTLLFTVLALTAFAANSILCRLALGEHSIDAASFTVIRLVSGVIALWLIVALRRGGAPVSQQGGWRAAFLLFLYAAAFSFAYLTLDAGVGALILFGTVQFTMILVSLYRGERLSPLEWAGVLLAFSGFVYLVSPGLSAPSFSGFILMTVAGVGWGGYTLLGRASSQPLLDTTANFTRALPFAIVLAPLILYQADVAKSGVVLAILSGAAASGVGYAIWYRALTGLSTTQAAVFQLLVPVIAALGGVIFLGEIVSLRFALAGLLILGGIALVIVGRSRP
jgi:drug/metabolite transporter (DMT)-like permease